MIHVTTIANPRLVQAFIDYMAIYQVELTIQVNQEQQVELWLADDTHLEKVRHELSVFLRDPLNPRYQAASWQTGKINNQFNYRNYLTFEYLKNQSGPLTMGILILSILIYIWMQISGDYSVMTYLAWPSEPQQLELWRWFSPIFLHFSISHIAFNLILWWYLAGQVERQLGFGKLFTITLVAALFSNWGQSIFSGSNFGGISGVVYALVAYVWLTGERQPEKGIYAPRGLMAISIIWLFLGYFSILGDQIANAAHTSGLIIGLLMGVWDNRHHLKQQNRL